VYKNDKKIVVFEHSSFKPFEVNKSSHAYCSQPALLYFYTSLCTS